MMLIMMIIMLVVLMMTMRMSMMKLKWSKKLFGTDVPAAVGEKAANKVGLHIQSIDLDAVLEANDLQVLECA